MPEFSQENGSSQVELVYFYHELTAFSLLSTSSYIKYEIRRKEGETGTAKGFWREMKWKVAHLYSQLFLALKFTDA